MPIRFIPEQHLVAMVRLDVIDDRGRSYNVARGAHPAQWFPRQVAKARALPPAAVTFLGGRALVCSIVVRSLHQVSST
ncbi:conserved protein of unknown function [Hyphomicrobium sp. 1Nfss2.1]